MPEPATIDLTDPQIDRLMRTIDMIDAAYEQLGEQGSTAGVAIRTARLALTRQLGMVLVAVARDAGVPAAPPAGS